jgi:hypothetical protein
MNSRSSRSSRSSIRKSSMSIAERKRREDIQNKTILEIDRLIEIIAFIVRDAGYSIGLDNSEAIIGKYIFFIINKNLSIPTTVSSIEIILKTDDTILETPTTRTLQRISGRTFYIEMVETNESYRGNGWAILLLFYTIAYLQILEPTIKFFTLSDESAKRFDMENNIYGKAGFLFAYFVEMDLSRPNTIKTTSLKKILDLRDYDSTYNWATNCLSHIEQFLKKNNMGTIEDNIQDNSEYHNGGKSKKQRNKKTRKQRNKRSRKHSRKYSRK